MATASSSSKNENDMEKILKSLKSSHINHSIKNAPKLNQHLRSTSILDLNETSSRSSFAVADTRDGIYSSCSSSSSLSDHNKPSLSMNRDQKIKTKSSSQLKNVSSHEKLSKNTNKLPLHPFLVNKSDKSKLAKSENKESNHSKKHHDIDECFPVRENDNKNNNNHYYGSKCGGGGQKNCPDLEYEHKSYDSSSEAAVRKKFKHVNKIFYNGFLNSKQDKHHHHSNKDGAQRCNDHGLPEYQAHASELLHFLKSLWVTNTMCDLSIVIDNKKYPAHRVSLAMFSKKYRNEFQKQLQNNKNTGIYTICLKCTTSFALESILKYIYTAKIDINPANVEEILAGARELGIDDLICMATDYLSSLSIGDVLDYMGNMLNKDGAELMVYELYAYMMTHLDKISRTPEYFKVILFMFYIYFYYFKYQLISISFIHCL